MQVSFQLSLPVEGKVEVQTPVCPNTLYRSHPQHDFGVRSKLGGEWKPPACGQVGGADFGKSLGAPRKVGSRQEECPDPACFHTQHAHNTAYPG